MLDFIKLWFFLLLGPIARAPYVVGHQILSTYLKSPSILLAVFWNFFWKTVYNQSGPPTPSYSLIGLIFISTVKLFGFLILSLTWFAYKRSLLKMMDDNIQVHTNNKVSFGCQCECLKVAKKSKWFLWIKTKHYWKFR